MTGRTSEPHAGDSIVWSVMATLFSGPTLYGLVGFGVDKLTGATVGVPIGIVGGFVLSGYIIYMRYGRENIPSPNVNGDKPERAHDDD